jgi:hypothetical protein
MLTHVAACEGDGNMWPCLVSRMVVALVILQLTIIGLFSLKQATLQSSLLAPLPIISLYALRVWTRIFRQPAEFLPISMCPPPSGPPPTVKVDMVDRVDAAVKAIDDALSTLDRSHYSPTKKMTNEKDGKDGKSHALAATGQVPLRNLAYGSKDFFLSPSLAAPRIEVDAHNIWKDLRDDGARGGGGAAAAAGEISGTRCDGGDIDIEEGAGGERSPVGGRSENGGGIVGDGKMSESAEQMGRGRGEQQAVAASALEEAEDEIEATPDAGYAESEDGSLSGNRTGSCNRDSERGRERKEEEGRRKTFKEKARDVSKEQQRVKEVNEEKGGDSEDDLLCARVPRTTSRDTQDKKIQQLRDTTTNYDV